MREIEFRTPTTMQDALALVECRRTNPGRLVTLLRAWAARGLDLNQPLGTQPLLYTAVVTQRPWLAKALLEAGADPMALHEGQPAFISAAFYNETSILKDMLDTGRVKVNAQDAHGQTAGHYLAENNNREALEMLVKAGANLFMANGQDMEALDIAARWQGHAVYARAVEAEAFLRRLRPAARQVVLEEGLPQTTRVARPSPRF